MMEGGKSSLEVDSKGQSEVAGGEVGLNLHS